MSKLLTSILRGRPSTVLGTGLLLIILFWLFDAMIDHHVFGKGNLLQQRLNDSGKEFWFRLVVTAFLAWFTGYAWLVVRHRDRLAVDLEATLNQAKDAQARSEAILSAISDGISIHDRELRILHQNGVHQAMTGGDFLGKPCYEAYFCGEEICAACPLADAMTDGQVHRLERTGRPGSGIEFIEITASPVRNAHETIVGVLAIVRDISERKWAEDAIRQQTLFFQRLIDTIPSPVFYKNTLGIFLGCNEAFARCIGFERRDIVGRTLFELLPRDVAAMYSAKDEELFTAPGSQIYESYVTCRTTGEERQVLFSKATFSDPDDEVAGLVGVVIDIHDRVQAEAAIRSLNRSLSRQAAELAAVNRELEAYNYSFTHDLRNNLTRISSASQLLLEVNHPQLDQSGQHLLQWIITAADQIHELSEAMQLLFSVTRREMQLELVNLSELATTAATDLQLTATDRIATFIIQPDLTVRADRRLMRVLMANLLGNAWKYTSRQPDARIEFGQDSSSGENVYLVRDNGAGFPAELVDRLFTPFTRLHEVEEFPGTGIGLATVQRIVQRHGGTIRAEGKPGQGATFWFTLPSTGHLNSV